MHKYLISMLLAVMMIWNCGGDWSREKKLKALSIITTVYNPDSSSIDSTKLYYEYNKQGNKVHFSKYVSEPNEDLYLYMSEDYNYNPEGNLYEVIRLDSDGSPFTSASYEYDARNNIKIKHKNANGELTSEVLKQFNEKDQRISKQIKNITYNKETLIFNQYDDQGRGVYTAIFEQDSNQVFPTCTYLNRQRFNDQGSLVYSESYNARSGAIKFYMKYDSTENGIIEWINTVPGIGWSYKQPGIDSNWVQNSFTEFNADGKVRRITTYQNEVRKGLRELKLLEDKKRTDVDKGASLNTDKKNTKSTEEEIDDLVSLFSVKALWT